MAEPYSARPTLETAWKNTEVKHLIPALTEPPSPDDVPGILEKVRAFCHLFVGGGQHEPVFIPREAEAREKVNKLATEMLAICVTFAKDARAILGLNAKRRLVLYNHIMGNRHNGRPLEALLQLSANLLGGYVARESVHMVKALKSPAALGLASRLLYVGGRDWAKLTNWEKINVTLEAQRYRHDMKSKAPPRPSDTATPGPSSSVEASMGHHHTPSLTSRQAQRTGVSQERLRARWA